MILFRIEAFAVVSTGVPLVLRCDRRWKQSPCRNAQVQKVKENAGCSFDSQVRRRASAKYRGTTERLSGCVPRRASCLRPGFWLFLWAAACIAHGYVFLRTRSNVLLRECFFAVKCGKHTCSHPFFYLRARVSEVTACGARASTENASRRRHKPRRSTPRLFHRVSGFRE
jgi:hypothetical protein